MSAIRNSDPDYDRPIEDLLPEVYAELRALAAAHIRSERRDHTLQPTALVHEVYLKLSGRIDGTLRGRTHFLALATRAMRQILVDHARRRLTAKRGRGQPLVSFEDTLALAPLGGEEFLDLDRAIDRLARVDERGAQIVNLRFFAGLNEREVAEVLGISERTIRYDWTFARAWLREALTGGSASAEAANPSP